MDYISVGERTHPATALFVARVDKERHCTATGLGSGYCSLGFCSPAASGAAAAGGAEGCGIDPVEIGLGLGFGAAAGVPSSGLAGADLPGSQAVLRQSTPNHVSCGSRRCCRLVQSDREEMSFTNPPTGGVRRNAKTVATAMAAE